MARELDLTEIVATALQNAGIHHQPLVIAVSGGPDSTALLHCAVALRERLHLSLTAAHVEHALREDSAIVADFVGDLCLRLEVPLALCRCEVAAEAQQRGRGIEETARLVRREHFSEIARHTRSAWVALAHSADDQAETVLHRLLRGTGIRGLAGMAMAAPLCPGVQLIRPLLDTGRHAMRYWLSARGLEWRDDPSNLDPRFTRNRLRHELLPQLGAQYNPDVTGALCRLASQCRDAASFLAGAAAALLSESLLERSSDIVRLSVTPWRSQPRVLLREALVILWTQQSWPQQGMSFEHWERLAGLVLDDSTTGRIDLPGGLFAIRTGELLRCERPARN